MLHFEIIATMRSPVNEIESQIFKKNRNIKKSINQPSSGKKGGWLPFWRQTA